MQQYLELLREIKEKGTVKPAAREGMPNTLSLFGAQFRHNLADGFPLLTTKKMYWKGIVTELLWFLRGDTNIKYLVDNGCNIWNEDAYQYYLKTPQPYHFSFEDFIGLIKSGAEEAHITIDGYKLGDCGYQYGKVWRSWQADVINEHRDGTNRGYIDQIKNLIEGLKNSPESRRHIVTAIDPAHDRDLALYWCHALFQFNCRPLNTTQRIETSDDFNERHDLYGTENAEFVMDQKNFPKYVLDCHLYQRSADAFLGVPFNIASYALLTHILCKICNMLPGDLITSYGDLHIYDSHIDAVNEQLSRSPRELPTLIIDDEACDAYLPYLDFNSLTSQDFKLEGYNPYPAIKAELTTGLKK